MTKSDRFGFMVARFVAAGFALWATARHPYSFYILTRWVVFVTCCWGVYRLRLRLWPSFAPAYAVVGLILNPIAPFHFSRGTWHNLDVAAAVILLASIPFDRARPSPPADHPAPRKSP
jgi:hypothetical protein